MRNWISFLLFVLCLTISGEIRAEGNKKPGAGKIKDIVIYKDPKFFAAFPSVIKRPDGELLVAFRRAPDRRLFGEVRNSHTDPNSYLVLVRSNDGENWSKEPDLIYAHPFGGSQDPCMLQLRDGTLLCFSYVWALIRPDADSILNRKISLLKGKVESAPAFAFMGGYQVRSTDGGKTWQGPFYPPPVPHAIKVNVFGEPLPAHNRGALCEGKSGRIFWVVAALDREVPAKTSTHLLVSDDKGITWHYSCPVAEDEKVSFNEASTYETPKGDLVVFLRTADMPERHCCIARSKDGGKTFTWQSMGFIGLPLHALRLPDNRVLLTYGFRNKPYGIRAKILNPECTDFAEAAEIILRDDGGSGDLGYPWSVQLDKNRVLVVYYFNRGDETRQIDGTILEIDKE